MKKIYFLIILVSILCCKSNQTAVIQNDEKYGLINRNGEIIVSPEYDYIIKSISTNLFMVEKNEKYGFINNQGKIVIPIIYDDASPFYERMAAVKKENKYGFIDSKGRVQIPFKFDDVFLGFSKGLSDVIVNDSCGYINKHGKVIIALKYETCYPFQSEVALIYTFEEQSLLIDKKGRTYKYDKNVVTNQKLWATHNSYPKHFKTNTGRGSINKKGDTIIPPFYSSVGNFQEKKSIVERNGKWGFYDEKGKMILKPTFEDLWHFTEGLARFKLNGLYGYVDKKGEIVIEPTYESAGEFRNGLAYVKLKGLFGYINRKGEIVIEPKFEKASHFE